MICELIFIYVFFFVHRIINKYVEHVPKTSSLPISNTFSEVKPSSLPINTSSGIEIDDKADVKTLDNNKSIDESFTADWLVCFFLKYSLRMIRRDLEKQNFRNITVLVVEIYKNRTL